MTFSRLLTGFIALLFFTVSSAQQAAPSASEVLKEATQKAKKEKKNVFLIFHSSSCGWCRAMDAAMSDASCKPLFAKQYVIRHITVDESEANKSKENPGGVEMMEEYNGKKQGLPYWVVLDKNGKLLEDSKLRPEGVGLDAGSNVGCPAKEEEIDYFISVLKKTSSLKDNELNIIAERFKKIRGH